MLHSDQLERVPIENKFSQLPKLKKLRPGREWTYFLLADCAAGVIKIGHSMNLKWRLTGLQTQSPVQLRLVGLAECPAGTEVVLHQALAASRSHGEWFNPTPDVHRIRASLPKGGRIETPDLVRIVKPFGIPEKRVQQILVWALSTAKHADQGEDRKPGRTSIPAEVELWTSPRGRRALTDLAT